MLPHECECRTCGRKMFESPFLSQIDYSDPKFTGAAVMDINSMGFSCIKHGIIPSGTICLKCAEETAQAQKTTT